MEGICLPGNLRRSGLPLGKLQELWINQYRIEDAVVTLSLTPPKLAVDIYNTGLYLAGGGAMLCSLDKRISQKTDLPVYIAEDPLSAVVRGTGTVLKSRTKYKSVLIQNNFIDWKKTLN